MKIVSKFYEITFSNEESKVAYLKASKWLAKCVYGNSDMTDVLVDVQKMKEAKEPTFKVSLYVSLDREEFDAGFCDRCKSIHKAWFVNESYDCNSCKKTAYKNQIDEKILIKQNYRIDKLKQLFKKQEEE